MNYEGLRRIVACGMPVFLAASCGSSESASTTAPIPGQDAAPDASEAAAGGSAGEDGGAGAGGSAQDAPTEHDSGECTPGTGRCDGQTAQVCSENGSWQVCTTCPFLDSDSHNCGTCGHDCQGQPCKAGACEAITLATFPQLNPGGLAVDATSVYWTTGDSVLRVSVNGGEPVTLAHGGIIRPLGLAIDGKNVYFASNDESVQDGGSLWKVGLDGGTPVEILTSAGPVRAVAVDSTNVYWTTDGQWDTGTVKSMGLTGGTPVTLADYQQDVMYGIAVDLKNVYWTSCCSKSVQTGRVQKVALTGGTPESISIGVGSPNGIAIDATHLFWTNWDGYSVEQYALKDGAISTVASNQPYTVSVAVDAQNVYWITRESSYSGTGDVWRVARGGGTPMRLATGQSYPDYIAVDATSVYWTTAEADQTGAVKKLQK